MSQAYLRWISGVSHRRGGDSWAISIVSPLSFKSLSGVSQVSLGCIPGVVETRELVAVQLQDSQGRELREASGDMACGRQGTTRRCTVGASPCKVAGGRVRCTVQGQRQGVGRGYSNTHAQRQDGGRSGARLGQDCREVWLCTK